MTFSKPLLGTNTNKIRMTWIKYIFTHLIPSAFQSFRNNFITWTDLVWFTNNQKNYTLLKDDDPFEQCYLTFWYDLNDDNTYPKEFLEYLMRMAEDVRTGKVEPLPFTKDMMNELEDLVGYLIEDDIETGTSKLADD